MGKINDEQKQQVIELRRQGLGYRRIANKIDGLNRSNVRDFVKTKWFAENHPELVKIDVDRAIKAPKRYGEAKCKHCGTEFVKRAGHQKYCGTECRYECGRKDKPELKEYSKKCRNCELEFITSQTNKIYCKAECKREYYAKVRKEKRSLDTSRRCTECGRRLPKHASKYCADKCFDVSRERYYKNRQHNSSCKECGSKFLTNELHQKFCSQNCAIESRRIHPLATCERCGEEFASKPERANKFCDRGCYLEQIGGTAWMERPDGFNRARNETHIRRAKRYGADYETINVDKLFNDSEWVCGICNESVDKYLPYPNPESASLDHIIPLSKGGTHTLKNVQLAHLGCNRDKYDTI